VWDAMNDIENWPNLFTEYASAEVLDREGDVIRFRLTTYPDPEHNGQVWSWVSERRVDAATHTTQSRRIETGPFKYMDIEWTFEPTDEGTRMRWVQSFSMKPEAPADDAGAQEYLNRNTRIQMAAIKDRLEAAFTAAR
jgi:aromatase